MQDRARQLDAVYGTIDQLEAKVGGRRTLSTATARSGWPSRGIYLFFEPGEVREDGVTLRVTRVGTHALTATSRTNLWNRLSQHRGSVGGENPGGGNHRGSVFRRHVGSAIVTRDGRTGSDTWGQGSNAPRAVRDQEVELERAVSAHIRSMPLLWLPVEDRHDRAAIERDLIALLSNAERTPIDPASPGWLGHHADADAIRRSGLWNVHHVDKRASGEGIDLFLSLVNDL